MDWESSSELDNLVFTPIDAGFPFHSPPSDLPHVQPSSHTNIDQLQSLQGDLRPSVSAVELEPGFEPENFVSIPSPSSDLPPVQPCHTIIDRFESATPRQFWEPPNRSSNPTDLELLEHLRPLVEASGFQHGPQKNPLDRRIVRKDVANNPAVVNAGLPLMNPSELPEMVRGRRQMFYLTDYHQLCYNFVGDLKTPSGFWRQICSGSPIWDEGQGGEIAGFKKTFAFYFWKDPLLCVEAVDGNWVMNVYSVVNNTFREDELVLSHVFEDTTRARKTFRTCRANPNCKWIITIPRESSPLHRGVSHRPRLNSYLTMFEEVLLGDSDPDPAPDSSMETGHYMPTRDVSPIDDRGNSPKRKRISIVWDYFTKIYARDIEGNVVTLAACNHCSKVLTANSKSGTRHLLAHTCPCKFKPVEAGGKESQPSSACC